MKDIVCNDGGCKVIFDRLGYMEIFKQSDIKSIKEMTAKCNRESKEAHAGEPLISVIVACYNIADHISRCLDSVIAQTYDNLEIIVVDDGSTDESGKICDTYATRDPRIKVIHKSNAGLGPARNTGFEASTGEYIAYVDGDDYIAANMYEVMLSAIIEHEADMSVCRYKQASVEEAFSKDNIRKQNDIYIMNTDESLFYLISEDLRYVIQNAAWNKLYKRELVQDIAFPARRYEDMVYTAIALSRAEKMAYIDTPLYNYVTDRKGSIMNSSTMDSIINEQLVSYREKDDYLKSIDRQDLVYMHDYMVYKKLLLLYTEARRGKNPDRKQFMNELKKVIDGSKNDFDKIYSCKIADPHQKMRMELFLKNPLFYNIFMDLNDNIVLPFRRMLRSRVVS